MLDEILREIVVLIAGKQSENIAEFLNSKDYVNEFNLAKKMNLTINQTRNILYKISDYGLVISVRKKDKKKGWYTYFWKFDNLKCLEFFRKSLVDQKDILVKNLDERKNKIHYFCSRCNLEVGEEESLLMNFMCNECGDVFIVKEDDKIISGLEKSIGQLDKKIELVDLEIEKEQGKLSKKKDKKLKILEKEKDDKKKEATEKRRAKLKQNKEEKEKLRAKEEKTKKVAKKKIIKKVQKKKSLVKKKVIKKKILKKKVIKKSSKKK